MHEPLNLLTSNAKRHGTVALESQGRIHFWNTEALYGWISVNKTHPITRKILDKYEIDYVEHYFKCLKFEEQMQITDNFTKTIYETFIKANGKLPDNLLFISRVVLNLQDFAEHFKNYQETDNELQFERKQAEKELNKKIIGTWLIRNSSVNRPINQKHSELLKKLGIKTFALSFVDKQGSIKHLLFGHFPGKGWAYCGNGIKFTCNSVKPNIKTKYFPCFCDLIIHILKRCDLTFEKVSTNYYSNK
jgi:hypothetical protein